MIFTSYKAKEVKHFCTITLRAWKIPSTSNSETGTLRSLFSYGNLYHLYHMLT